MPAASPPPAWLPRPGAVRGRCRARAHAAMSRAGRRSSPPQGLGQDARGEAVLHGHEDRVVPMDRLGQGVTPRQRSPSIIPPPWVW